MGALSDDKLMRMYREGDADAFDALFDRYHAPVYNFARMMLDGAPGADDVLQETFLAVARAAGDYEPRGRFRAWIMRVARNQCLDCLRAATRRRLALVETGLGPAEPVSREARPPEWLAADEHADALYRLIAALPERQREAVVLRAFEGMSYGEIASTLGVPINTVKTLIHRGRAALAAGLEEYERE